MIRITTGYGDLLNLYGDRQNADALMRYFSDAGVSAGAGGFSVGSFANFSKSDLLLFGAGTERRMLAALSDIRRYYADIRRYYERGGYLLALGNSLALFGKTVTDRSGTVHEAAGVFDFDVRITGERRYGEMVLTSGLFSGEVIGGVNSSLRIDSREQPLFSVVKESRPFSGGREGAYKDHFFASELSGPVLIRNPGMLRFFAEALADKKLPENKNAWFCNAKEGYRRALLTLQKELRDFHGH